MALSVYSTAYGSRRVGAAGADAVAQKKQAREDHGLL
jgi:F0F1-type ATP synthase membrane subunit c/vacuolar-type H+-ATPase subunit K